MLYTLKTIYGGIALDWIIPLLGQASGSSIMISVIRFVTVLDTVSIKDRSPAYSRSV